MQGHRAQSLVRGAHALPHVAKEKKKTMFFLNLGNVHHLANPFSHPKNVGVALDQLASSPTYIKIVLGGILKYPIQGSALQKVIQILEGLRL